MRLETFFEKFELLADAPNAVPKLRALLLNLAVRGRLVPQDAAEGSASELVAEIRGRAAAPRRTSEQGPEWISVDEIPGSWEIAALGEVSEIARGVSFPGDAKSKVGGDGLVACLRTASVQAEIDWQDLIYVPDAVVARDDQWVRPLDIMISMANSYDLVGKVALVRDVRVRSTFGAFLAAIRPVLIDPRFLLCVLRCSGMQEALRAGSSQTTNIANISLGRMRPLAFPVPPLPEQKRIVAKVDELMALCDRLEAQQQERQTRHAALARASLARFADAPAPSSVGLLFHDTYSVETADLRKTILSLAIQGKLVAQDPTDEPAQVSLDRLAARREMLPAQRLKMKRSMRELDHSMYDHDIPTSWAWCRLGDLVLDFRYGTSRKCDRDARGVPVLRIPNIKGGLVDSEDLKFADMPPSEFEELRLREGDLLLVRSNGSESLVGRSAVASRSDERFAYAGYLVRARLARDVVASQFVHLALSAQVIRDQIEGPIRTTSGVKNINTSELSNLVLPLPPIQEQRRIVAKVDELAAMVDGLEERLLVSRKAVVGLMDAVLSELAPSA